MADHGYSLGQHGRFEKHTSYEPNLRVPLIFRYPGKIRQGAVVNEFTQSIDVPPTLLELLNAEPFKLNHGQSLGGYLTKGKVAAPRQSIFTEYLENEEACVRTSRWKYVHCSGKRARTDGYITDNPTPGRTIHLFDLQNDADEFHNVADKHPEVTQQLAKDLLTVYRSTHPERRGARTLPWRSGAEKPRGSGCSSSGTFVPGMRLRRRVQRDPENLRYLRNIM